MLFKRKEHDVVLKSCTRCSVFNKKGLKISEARVDISGEKIKLYFPRFNLKNIHYKGRVDFYDTYVGLVTTICDLHVKRNLDYPEMLEPWMADCVIEEVDQVLQRQKDVRVEVSLMVGFKAPERRNINFAGRITNLSAGGFYMVTTQELRRGEVITFAYRFRTEERHFSATVLRGELHSSGSYGYGCRFYPLSDRAETAVRGFVYKKLAEQKHKQ